VCGETEKTASERGSSSEWCKGDCKKRVTIERKQGVGMVIMKEGLQKEPEKKGRTGETMFKAITSTIPCRAGKIKKPGRSHSA